MPTIAWYLQQRAKAMGQGDRGMIKAINADLARLGYVDSPPRPEAVSSSAMETTALAMPEHAVPERPRRGRPPHIVEE